MREVAAPVLAAIADPDARENYRHLVSLRDGVQAAGSLQAWGSAQFSHGVHFKLGNARSGLKPLAVLLERWVRQLLGTEVRIMPVPRIDDARWRWHVGLDVEATALLNDLYAGTLVDGERLARIVGLFRLQFANAAEMRADVAGVPVYLALMANPQGQLRMKPQNLLLNLPLAARS